MSRSSARIIFLLRDTSISVFRSLSYHALEEYTTAPLNVDGTVFYMSTGAGVVVKYSSGSHDALRETPVWYGRLTRARAPYP